MPLGVWNMSVSLKQSECNVSARVGWYPQSSNFWNAAFFESSGMIIRHFSEFRSSKNGTLKCQCKRILLSAYRSNAEFIENTADSYTKLLKLSSCWVVFNCFTAVFSTSSVVLFCAGFSQIGCSKMISNARAWFVGQGMPGSWPLWPWITISILQY